MKNFIYLDNAASMQADPEMIERFCLYALEYFPNPEAEHVAGRDCRKELADAGMRAAIALTGTDEYDIFWTASATEAMNIALSCPEITGTTVLTSRSEHPSLAEPLKAADLELLKVNIRHDGTFDLDDFYEKISPEVSAVCLHHVQNETGAMQNLLEVREIMDRKAPGALLIADTVQSVGKVNVPWLEANINIAFVGGHKLSVPSGGALVCNLPDKKQKNALVSHLAKLRSSQHAIGRIDPPVALTLADAIEYAENEKISRFDKVSHLNYLLRQYLKESEVDARFLLTPDVATPYIASLMIPPYQGQILVRMLAKKGVMVSEGSACAAASKDVSSALLAMGVSKDNARCVLRISFGYWSVESDVNEFVASLQEVLQNY